MTAPLSPTHLVPEFRSWEPAGRSAGPFSTGLIAIREFDTCGDHPEMAAPVNEVQGFMRATLPAFRESQLVQWARSPSPRQHSTLLSLASAT